jgi:hypothetical protein
MGPVATGDGGHGDREHHAAGMTTSADTQLESNAPTLPIDMYV